MITFRISISSVQVLYFNQSKVKAELITWFQIVWRMQSPKGIWVHRWFPDHRHLAARHLVSESYFWLQFPTNNKEGQKIQLNRIVINHWNNTLSLLQKVRWRQDLFAFFPDNSKYWRNKLRCDLQHFNLVVLLDNEMHFNVEHISR